MRENGSQVIHFWSQRWHLTRVDQPSNSNFVWVVFPMSMNNCYVKGRQFMIAMIQHFLCYIIESSNFTSRWAMGFNWQNFTSPRPLWLYAAYAYVSSASLIWYVVMFTLMTKATSFCTLLHTLVVTCCYSLLWQRDSPICFKESFNVYQFVISPPDVWLTDVYE